MAPTRSRRSSSSPSFYVLRTGTAREDVVSLAQRLLVDHGGIAGLADCTMTELAAEHGLGLAYCLQVKVPSQMSSTHISVAQGGKGSVAAGTQCFHALITPAQGCRFTMRPMRLRNAIGACLAQKLQKDP